VDVFISDSRDDEALTSDVCCVLEARGHTVWRDTVNTPGGGDWRAVIEKAFSQCDAFLILLSPAIVGLAASGRRSKAIEKAIPNATRS
jgi:hypothetical protein